MALASLGGLPSRQTSSAEFDQATFFVALEGVTRYGLAEAVKAILQGSLNHAFFPSPPELRIQCNKSMEHYEAMDERIRRRQRENADWVRQFREPVRKTDETRAVVAAAHQAFHASHDAAKLAEDEAARAEIRAKYGMTQEVLDAMKDRPAPADRMGAKS